MSGRPATALIATLVCTVAGFVAGLMVGSPVGLESQQDVRDRQTGMQTAPRATGGPKQEQESRTEFGPSSNLDELAQRVAALRKARNFGLMDDEIAAYAAKSPLAVVNWAKTLEPVPARETALAVALTTWMKSDAPAAVAWARENASSFFRTSAFVTAVVASGDISLAEETILRDETREGRMLLGMLTAEWAKSDRDFILRWADARYPSRSEPFLNKDGQLEMDGTRTGAISSVLHSWAASDPETALTWVQTRGGRLDEKRTLNLSIVQGWIQNRGIDEVMSHLAQSPRQEAYGSVYAEIARTLSNQRPEETDEWIDRMPEADRLIAAQEIGGNLRMRESRPDIAAKLLLKYDPDPNRAATRMQAAMVQWFLRDEAAATAFLDGASSLPAEARDRMRTVMVATKTQAAVW